MATTTNFGWTTPNDTDLVKDGASAIRTLGSAIDASLGDLKGGTTGQVLAKNSNSDMDFVWSADASGIPATIFDAKGDLIAASAADTAARLAVGSDNTVLTADSSTSTGLKWATPSTGAAVFLNRTTFSGSTSFNVDSLFSDTYENYLIRIQCYGNTDGANIQLKLRYSTSTQSANYNYVYVGGGTLDNSPSISRGDSTSQFVLPAYLGAGNAVTAYDLNLYRGNGSSRVFYSGAGSSYGAGQAWSGAGYCTSSQTWTGLQVLASSGTITGQITIYGLVKA